MKRLFLILMFLLFCSVSFANEQNTVELEKQGLTDLAVVESVENAPMEIGSEYKEVFAIETEGDGFKTVNNLEVLICHNSTAHSLFYSTIKLKKSKDWTYVMWKLDTVINITSAIHKIIQTST